MNHFYESVEGWFDFDNVYREALQRCPEGGRMAEVGVCYGRSLFFMAVEIVNSGKQIELHAIDSFRWPVNVWDEFCQNCESHGLKELIRTHRSLSVPAAQRFPDAFFDFVFIDAAHDYSNVTHDIRAWWPKVKPGGVLAGHDWCSEFAGVEKAVKEYFLPDSIRLIAPKSWWVEK